jgi:hypothetical protein
MSLWPHGFCVVVVLDCVVVGAGVGAGTPGLPPVPVPD